MGRHPPEPLWYRVRAFQLQSRNDKFHHVGFRVDSPQPLMINESSEVILIESSNPRSIGSERGLQRFRQRVWARWPIAGNRENDADKGEKHCGKCGQNQHDRTPGALRMKPPRNKSDRYHASAGSNPRVLLQDKPNDEDTDDRKRNGSGEMISRDNQRSRKNHDKRHHKAGRGFCQGRWKCARKQYQQAEVKDREKSNYRYTRSDHPSQDLSDTCLLVHALSSAQLSTSVIGLMPGLTSGMGRAPTWYSFS